MASDPVCEEGLEEKASEAVYRCASFEFEPLVSSCAEAALEMLGMPVLAARADGALLFANRAATRLLHSGGPLQIEQDRLCLCRPGDQRRFAAALRDANSSPGARGGFISVACDKAVPLILRVVPMPCDSAWACRAALVYVGGTVQSFPGASDVARCFGLSQAEAEIAVRFGAGGSLASVAAARGVSVNTVRTLVQRAYTKTGLNSQAQLGWLLLQVPALAIDR